MSIVNLQTREVSIKIVYYGTGLGGKTTNLKYIYSQVSAVTRGELISLATETERTLFFDFLPLDLGKVRDFSVRLSLYTVPGQVEYNASRKLILNGADGIIFVADSDVLKEHENAASLANMRENLAEYGLQLHQVPLVMQYNKRDLSTAMSVDRMEAVCNQMRVPSFEAIAQEGHGVFSTLKTVCRLTLNRLQ
jgi:signal recognition particle receptor subunit beta